MPDDLFMALLGEDLTAITITPVTAIDHTTGAMTLGAAVDLVGVILETDATLQIINQDIRPVNEPGMNEVPISSGRTLRIAVIQEFVSPINQVVEDTLTRRFQVHRLEGGEDRLGYYTLRNWNGGIKDRGMNPAVLELGPCKPKGVPQEVRSVA
jgi:hypothetical protein